MVDNIDVFTSVGGLFAGFIDVDVDGKLNNRLWRVSV